MPAANAIKQAANATPEFGVTARQYEEMKEIFAFFDAEGVGSIDPKEIRTQMSSLGFEVDNTTLYQLISDLDSDGSQKIEFEEFAGLLRDELELYKPSATTRHSCNEIFDFMDELDPDKRDAKIEPANLRRVANVLGDNVTDAELEIMIRRADRKGKGYVSCEDFYELMVDIAQKMEEDGDGSDSASSEEQDGDDDDGSSRSTSRKSESIGSRRKSTMARSRDDDDGGGSPSRPPFARSTSRKSELIGSRRKSTMARPKEQNDDDDRVVSRAAAPSTSRSTLRKSDARGGRRKSHMARAKVDANRSRFFSSPE